jgi:hypothetical protein
MESLATLESNLLLLLQQYRDLQQQLVALQEENQHQRDEIMRTHTELLQLRADYKHLETAHTLLLDEADGEKRERVKQRISNLIAQVDRALEALTK